MIEIEHRYLLKNLPDTASRDEPGELLSITRIMQYYQGDMRYRKIMTTGEEPLIYKQIKIMNPSALGISNESDPTPVSQDDFTDGLIKVYPHYISKVRHTYRSLDPQVQIFVDVFKNLTLVILEVEIPATHYPYILPDNIKEQVIMPITGIVQLSNKYLVP